MKKILFLINTLRCGGAEHVLVDIANRLAVDGYDIYVQTLFDDGDYRKNLSDKIRYLPGIKVKNRLFERAWWKILTLLPGCVIRKMFMRNVSYDVEVGFMEGLPTKVISSCLNQKTMKIAWVHTDLNSFRGSECHFSSIGNERKSYKRFDKIVCVSNGAKQGFFTRICKMENVYVQYNPINDEQIRKMALEENNIVQSSGITKKMVSVGRLVPQKGFDILIDAMRLVIDQGHDVVLYIVGEGPERCFLEKKIRENVLERNVFLTGYQENPYSILGRCDLQIVSSRVEGYSLVLCEGHILGIPAVSTKCVGPQEIIEMSNGGLLVDLSSKALADGIITMLSNDKLYEMYRSNVLMWSQNYSSAAMYSHIEQLFEK